MPGRTRSLTTLPKAHLHLHFTGSMRIDTLRDLAHQKGMRLPSALVDEWPPRLRATGSLAITGGRTVTERGVTGSRLWNMSRRGRGGVSRCGSGPPACPAP